MKAFTRVILSAFVAAFMGIVSGASTPQTLILYFLVLIYWQITSPTTK